jgi:hypothetical protein
VRLGDLLFGKFPEDRLQTNQRRTANEPLVGKEVKVMQKENTPVGKGK